MAANRNRKKTAPRRGASPSRSHKPAASTGSLPPWALLATGIAMGFFVGFLVFLGGKQVEQGPVTATPAPEPERPAQNAAEQEPKFDFYAVLPKMEIIVPQQDSASRPSRSETPATSPAPAERPSTPSRDTPATDPLPDGRSYVLQAGSFRSASDAERRRADLILQGFSASVQPVKLNGDSTWYRVMIGPYDNRKALQVAQENLADNGIETLPIQVRQ